MAVTNLSNQHISASYQNLMQISSSNALYNGTGSLIPNLAVTASFALSASYFQGNSVSASYVKLAQSASYVLLAKSSSFAFTASYNSGNSLSASYAVTASYAQLATNAETASFNLNSVSASYAATASVWSGIRSGSVQITGSLTQGSGSITTALYSHAEGISTTASGFASHAEGIFTTASSSYSHAEGYQTTASGVASHAEGAVTVASNTGAHAEGAFTVGDGSYSHAEGYFTTASGQYSHAEGRLSKAQGIASHAEGYGTLAKGDYSHAEGLFISASANYSHAEGYFTVAEGLFQHVQGQYNISSSAQSAFIHGNGTSDAARSNLIFASSSQVQVSGSLIVTGSNTLIGNKTITGSVFILGNKTITGSVFISGSKTVIGANTITGSLSVSGSITSTSGFIKSGSGSQYLLADGTTSTNGTLFKTGSVAYALANTTQTIVSSALTTSQFADYDTIQLTSIVNTPIDAVAVVLIEVYVNGSPNMTGSPVKLAEYNGPASNRYWWFDRTFWIQGGNINVRAANTSNSTSVGTFGSALSAVSLPSPTFYLILQITTTSTDTARASVFSIQKI